MASNQGRMVVVFGPPGTGKTYYLERQARNAVKADHKPHELVACSFTRAAAANLAGRDELGIPKQQIGTLHALAYRQLNRPELVEKPEHIRTWNENYPQFGLSTGSQDPLIEGAIDAGSQKPGDRMLSEYNILRAKRVAPAAMPMRIKPFTRAWEDFKTQTGGIDFTDMIQLGIDELPHAPGDPRLILFDEVQDFTALELELATKWGKKAETAIFSGDDDQCLYSFKGCDPASMINLAHQGGTMTRTLNQSYRVPAAVHDIATRWIKQIPTYGGQREDKEYRPKVDPQTDEIVQGMVRVTSYTYDQPERVVDVIEQALENEPDETHMVLTTCSYMLDPLKAVLRKRGLPFFNPYRTTRGDWNPLHGGGVTTAQRIHSFLMPAERGVSWTYSTLYEWVEIITARGVLKHGAKGTLAGYAKTEGTKGHEIRRLSMDEVARFFEDDAALFAAMEGDVKWFENHLLASKKKAASYPLAVYRRRGISALTGKPKILIGTVHSVKGGEADHVYLFPDLSRAGMEQWMRRGQPAIIRQFYVGMTRAVKSLTLCAAAGRNAVNIKG